MISAPADDEAWDRAVACYDLTPYRITAPGHELRLFRRGRGGLITNAPYLEYGGISASPGELLVEHLPQLQALVGQRGVRSVLLKARQPLLTAADGLVVDTRFVSFELDLSAGADALWDSSLQAKTRNQIRKGERGDFRHAVGDSALLDDFYSVLSECWRDLGTPIHAKRFFAAIAEQFQQRCRFHLLYAQSKPVSAALVLDINGVRHHPFAGTLNAYKPSSVNNLLYWKIIEDACEGNLDRFDMGRSELNSGTYRFKKSWGAVPLPLYYHYLLAPGCSPPDRHSPFMRACTGAWRHLPLRMTTLLGPPLIRNIL